VVDHKWMHSVVRVVFAVTINTDFDLKNNRISVAKVRDNLEFRHVRHASVL